MLAEAQTAVDEDEHDRARMLLRPLALRGLAEAQGLLGSSYSKHLSLFGDTPADGPIQEAHYWLSRAAAQGDARGQAGLGTLMLLWPEQHGLTSSETEALEWLEKSARQGNADAMGLLTLAYRNLKSHRDLGKVEYWQAELDKINAAADRGHDSRDSKATEPNLDEVMGSIEPVPGDQAVAVQADAASQVAVREAFRGNGDNESEPGGPHEKINEADASRRANALVAQSDEYLQIARVAASGSRADDVNGAVLDSGSRVVPAGGDALSIYRPNGSLAEVRLPEDVTVGFQEGGDVHVLSSGGAVHFLANGRACHASLGTVQVRYHPDGSSTVVAER